MLRDIIFLMDDTNYTDFSPNFDPSKVRSHRTETEQKLRRSVFVLKNRIFSVHSLVSLILPAIVVFLIIGSISNMSRNWSLEQQADAKKREIAIAELEVDRLKLENQYYASEEYQELAARRQQGKKLDGETLVNLPENSEKARHKYKTPTAAEHLSAAEKSNLDQWLLFLFGD